MKIPFLGGAYEGRSSNVSPETCMNLFYEKGKNGESLVGTAGDTLFSSPAVGEVRGTVDSPDAEAATILRYHRFHHLRGHLLRQDLTLPLQGALHLGGEASQVLGRGP